MPKPSQTARWEGTIEEPTEGEKTAGWVVDVAPPAEYFNWLFNRSYQWQEYLKDFENEERTWTKHQTFGPHTGGSANQSGTTAYGKGTGSGLVGHSGPDGSGAAGVFGQGNNLNSGGKFVGGVGGDGLVAAPGTAATASVPKIATVFENGFAKFFPVVNPNSNVGFGNTLTPKNIIKASALLETDGLGGVTIADGFNVTNPQIIDVAGVKTLRVDFVTPFSDLTYQPAHAIAEGGGQPVGVFEVARNAGWYEVGGINLPVGGAITRIDFSGFTTFVSLQFVGRN